MSQGMPDTTARHYRKRLLDMKIIVLQGDKYRFSTRRWRAKLEKLPPR